MKPIDFLLAYVQRFRKDDGSDGEAAGGAGADAPAKTNAFAGEVVHFRPKPPSPTFDPDDDPGPRAA